MVVGRREEGTSLASDDSLSRQSWGETRRLGMQQTERYFASGMRAGIKETFVSCEIVQFLMEEWLKAGPCKASRDTKTDCLNGRTDGRTDEWLVQLLRWLDEVITEVVNEQKMKKNGNYFQKLWQWWWRQMICLNKILLLFYFFFILPSFLLKTFADGQTERQM